MSKISRDNKKKAKKTTAEKAAAREANEAKGQRLNEGKCCTCRSFGKPCKVTGEFVARKKDACGKYKYDGD